MRVRVSPSPVRLGEAVSYRGLVLVAPEVHVRFEPPESGGALTWSRVRAGRSRPGWFSRGAGGVDSVWFEARVQVFALGPAVLPGPVVRLSALPGTTRPGTTRLPTVRLLVVPTITAADSDATLRALHGPVAAPWWERVPWASLLAVLAMLSSLVLLVRMLRGRPKPKPLPVPLARAAAPARPRGDPTAEALRALAALRAQALPQAGRFGEHALELTGILRRFLEATNSAPRPGDTSGELVARLRASRTPEADVERLAGLLSLWDRVKFARAPLTEAEAERCEDAVEGYVRSYGQARLEVAAAALAASSRAPGAPPTAPEAA
jgi:hypothetical protein